MSPKISSFLDHGSHTAADSLAIVQLSRDDFEPIYLQKPDGAYDGYAEGAVLNTRFGSFPHSTLIGIPWGSQVRASKVDTGSRGRKRKLREPSDTDPDNSTPGVAGEGHATPDKEEELEQDQEQQQRPPKKAVTAASGFVHILPPTPEIWTLSLPHRTQVVYTPDYSYILQKIRARPGTRLIEAGAGSGSFTHAAVRAVYSGLPSADGEKQDGSSSRGGVFSFEYHPERFDKMTAELKRHQLDSLVTLTHRDVYRDGFLVTGGRSPAATAVFLDLPAPWRAIPHLSRQKPPAAADPTSTPGQPSPPPNTSPSVPSAPAWASPLDPTEAVHLCTFSPCIEQVTRTLSALRRLGWVDIEVVELAHRRIQVYREKVGSHSSAAKGHAAPRDVEEAVERLHEVEDRFREHSRRLKAEREAGEGGMDVDGEGEWPAVEAAAVKPAPPSEPAKPWADGYLVTRTEPEIKTHTSYLVFAVLPREWTDEDEAAALARWPCGGETVMIGSLDRAARKEQKRQRMNVRKRRI